MNRFALGPGSRSRAESGLPAVTWFNLHNSTLFGRSFSDGDYITRCLRATAGKRLSDRLR
jgi:hypothetical protein